MTLRELLRVARDFARLTQAQVGAGIGWSDGTHINAIENGRKDTTFDAVDKWMDVCNCELAVLPKALTVESIGVAARLATLDEHDRELLARLARVIPRLDVTSRDRLESDLEFLEKHFPAK